MSNQKTKMGLCAALAASLVLACGAAVAPAELHTARDKLKEAKSSKAMEVAPVKVEEASQALDKADNAFKDGADDEEVRTLAYVALRTAELAISYGNQEYARKQSAEAMQQKMALQGTLIATTTEAQARANAELERERAKRAEAEKQAALALAQVAQVSKDKRGMVITLSGAVLFASGKSELLSMARSKLTEVAKALKTQGFKKLVVEGHTDSAGAPEKNEALSLRRAESVRTYLVGEGIESSKVDAVGHGPRQPIADNATPDGRANNRRVEIVVDPVQ